MPRVSRTFPSLFSWLFSIRARIAALVAGSLVLGLGLSHLASTALLVEDKVSYLYDHNFANVSELATVLDSQAERVAILSAVAGRLEPALGEDLFREKLLAAGTQSVAYFRFEKDGKPRIIRSLGENPGELASQLSRQGWNAQRLGGGKPLLGNLVDGRLPLAASTADSTGALAFFLAWYKPALEPVHGLDREFHLILTDPLGQAVHFQSASASGPRPEGAEAEAVVRDLWRSEFGSGVRERTIGGREFILGHRKLASDRLLLVRLVPKELAYSAIAVLKWRSLLLGGSVFSLSLGLTLLLVRRLTRGIRELWLATGRVSEGDFTVRVPETRVAGDELGALASAFNLMAGRIRELLRETAQKARMEKELETAQYVQNHFFPAVEFAHPGLSLAGRGLPATECAGDWWNYARLGETVLVAIGDVLGHGVSAALVTASVHSAYSIFVEEQRRSGVMPEFEQLPLGELVRKLNSAVLAAAGSDSSMSLFVGLIDLRTGDFRAMNHGHCAPVLFAPGGDGYSILEPDGDALLGLPGFEPGKEVRKRLEPGEALLLYTDGLFEPRARDHQRLSKRLLLERVRDRVAVPGTRGAEAVATLSALVESHWGSAPGDRLDDITFLVAVRSSRSASGEGKAGA
ncbi:MAG: SpoIIE family protein phosphatase [Oligoflexia bacterium]|nr:SpoIIE family protein phosphatase [Oligoflexia bacterium]